MTVSHLFIHYGLLFLALFGVVQCVRVLRIAMLDMKSLTASGTNGPKRLIVMGRLNQGAFLLAVFAVLTLIGARVALAHEFELASPLVITLIVSSDVIALILGMKEITIRRTRTKLDAYYDETHTAPTHAHRRSTDIGAVRIAQDAANVSQAAATLAQDAATVAQDEATSAQIRATDAVTEQEKQ